MPGLSAFAPRGLMPVAKVRAGHNWADATEAKKLPRARLMEWLTRSAIRIADRGKVEFPFGTGAGRSWINATTDDTEPVAYVGVMQGAGAKGGVPKYMGMIEKGITPHMVSLKHYGLRMFYKRTFGDSDKKSSKGFYRSVMTWESLKTFNGIPRERIGGKTAIPWLSRAIKHELPTIRVELHRMAARSN
jgi:hypothetical protein